MADLPCPDEDNTVSENSLDRHAHPGGWLIAPALKLPTVSGRPGAARRPESGSPPGARRHAFTRSLRLRSQGRSGSRPVPARTMAARLGSPRADDPDGGLVLGRIRSSWPPWWPPNAKRSHGRIGPTCDRPGSSASPASRQTLPFKTAASPREGRREGSIPLLSRHAATWRRLRP